MQRVLIIGSSGAGKSTLAAALAKKTGLPLIHLDAEYWNPGWVPTPDEAWHAKVKELAARDSWIMEGNYSGTFSVRIPRADTIILTTRPRWLCLLRAILRSIRYYGHTRPDMSEGCPERFDLDFYKWVWNFPIRTKARVDHAMATISAHALHIIIASDREADAFLERHDVVPD